jgi:hypothetical protein
VIQWVIQNLASSRVYLRIVLALDGHLRRIEVSSAPELMFCGQLTA